jgi:hypothetical protein
MSRRLDSTLLAGMLLCLLTGATNLDDVTGVAGSMDAEDAAERVCWREGDDFVRCVEGDGSTGTPAENMESAECHELRFKLYACVRITARVLPRFGEFYHHNGTQLVENLANSSSWSFSAVPHEFLRAFKLEKDQNSPLETPLKNRWSASQLPRESRSDRRKRHAREHGQVET